jgi:hypothetical protein
MGYALQSVNNYSGQNSAKMFQTLRIIIFGHEPSAKINNQTLERLIRREFDSREVEINQKFQQINSNIPGSKNRLSAAILKLANRDFDRIDYYINICNNDFRDVVAPAEYPGYSRVAFDEIAKWKKRQIYLSDWKEYSNWLRK